MSAYIVNKRHIDALITGAIEAGHRNRSPFEWYSGDRRNGDRLRNRLDSADAVGALLWSENVKSVRYRYPDDDGNDLPGPIGFRPGDADAYVFTPLVEPLTAVELLVAISGYEYQSCEHPGWEQSSAHDFCETLRRATIRSLPGYDEAKTWEVPSDRPVKSIYRRTR